MPAKLVFITGSKSGTSVELEPRDFVVGRRPEHDIVFHPDEILVSATHAKIVYRDGAFVVEDRESRNGTYINHERVTERILQPGDIIEFGLGGPAARFLEDVGAAISPTLDMGDPTTPSALKKLADDRAAAALAARAESEPDEAQDSGTWSRGFSSTREFVALAYQKTSKRARYTTMGLVALSVVGIGSVAVWQERSRVRLQESLVQFTNELALERGTRAQLEQDLTTIRTRYDSLLTAVETVDRQYRQTATNSRFVETVNRDFSQGVALIVYSYGFVREGTDKFLRFQVDAAGNRLSLRDGFGRAVPDLNFGGDGPPVSQQGSATGFLVDSAGWIVTNRHVAEPWNQDDGLEFLRARGLRVEPKFITLQVYFPPGTVYDAVVEGVSEDADLALMRTTSGVDATRPLRLGRGGTSVAPGERIVFMGYPTGVHNLMFRIAREERLEILNRIGDDPVDLARELASRGQIQPLVTAGSISDTTAAEIIHTAAATGGGSGGPLLGTNQTVLGIHYAAVRSPIEGDPFQTQRGVRVTFAWTILPAAVRDRLLAAPLRQR